MEGEAERECASCQSPIMNLHLVRDGAPLCLQCVRRDAGLPSAAFGCVEPPLAARRAGGPSDGLQRLLSDADMQRLRALANTAAVGDGGRLDSHDWLQWLYGRQAAGPPAAAPADDAGTDELWGHHQVCKADTRLASAALNKWAAEQQGGRFTFENRWVKGSTAGRNNVYKVRDDEIVFAPHSDTLHPWHPNYHIFIERRLAGHPVIVRGCPNPKDPVKLEAAGGQLEARVCATGQVVNVGTDTLLRDWYLLGLAQPDELADSSVVAAYNAKAGGRASGVMLQACLNAADKYRGNAVAVDWTADADRGLNLLAEAEAGGSRGGQPHRTEHRVAFGQVRLWLVRCLWPLDNAELGLTCWLLPRALCARRRLRTRASTAWRS